MMRQLTNKGWAYISNRYGLLFVGTSKKDLLLGWGLVSLQRLRTIERARRKQGYLGPAVVVADPHGSRWGLVVGNTPDLRMLAWAHMARTRGEAERISWFWLATTATDTGYAVPPEISKDMLCLYYATDRNGHPEDGRRAKRMARLRCEVRAFYKAHGIRFAKISVQKGGGR
jgi:hypothetical protein